LVLPHGYGAGAAEYKTVAANPDRCPNRTIASQQYEKFTCEIGREVVSTGQNRMDNPLHYNNDEWIDADDCTSSPKPKQTEIST